MEKESTSFWVDIKKYEDILAKEPRSYCFAPLSELYRKLGLLDDAVTVAKRGIEVHPEYIGGFMVLGRAHFEQGNRAEAKASLEKVVLATPENLIAQKILSQIYQEEGNLPAAERALQLLVTFNPEDIESTLVLEALQRSMQSYGESESGSSPSVESNIDLGSDEPFGESYLSEAAQSESVKEDEDSFSFAEFEDASAPLDSAVETLFPEEVPVDESAILPVPTVTLAQLYEGQGFLEKALEVYSELLNNDPANQSLRERITELSIRLGRESGMATVAEPFGASSTEASVSRLDDNLEDFLGDNFGSSFSSGSGRSESTLDLLEQWLDAIRRRKECR